MFGDSSKKKDFQYLWISLEMHTENIRVVYQRYHQMSGEYTRVCILFNVF